MKCELLVVAAIGTIKVYLDFCLMRMLCILFLASLIFSSCTRDTRSGGKDRFIKRKLTDDKMLALKDLSAMMSL